MASFFASTRRAPVGAIALATLLVSCSGACTRGSSSAAGAPADGGDVPGADADAHDASGADGDGPSVSPGVRLAAGGAHACAWRDGAGAVCWGRNAHGELGDGTTSSRSLPAPVPGLGGVVQMAAGGAGGESGHTCALVDGGKLLCWGTNTNGQLGDGTTVDRPAPAPVATLQGVDAVALGQSHTCARKSDGSVWCWGRGDSGQLGNGGLADQPSPVRVLGVDDAIDLAVGHYHACVRRASGAIACWGANACGELATGDRTTALTAKAAASAPAGVTALAAGGCATCALTGSGAVFCWGSDEYGQLGDGAGAPQVFRTAPVAVSGVSDAVQIAAGSVHACARRASGAIACWGANAVGQLGDGTKTPATRPVAVSGVGDAVDLIVHGASAFVPRAGGTVVGWGGNGDGQLGDGTTTARSSPVVVHLSF